MVKRKVAWEIYVVSAILTLFILLIGIYFGVLLSKSKIQELEKGLINLKLSEEDLILELKLPYIDKNISCSILNQSIQNIMEEAATLADKVLFYEENERIKDETYYTFKKDYTLTLIRYWLYTEELKKNCDKNEIVTILYFYSNKNCGDCLAQGTILTFLKQKYPQNLMIFALDYDIELYVIKILKATYKLEKLPTLIINGKKYEGLVTLEKLSEILCLEHKLC